MNSSTSPTEQVTVPTDPRITSFDFFLLAISILSLLNMVLLILLRNSEGRSVVLIVDGVLSLFFLFNFGKRLWNATDRRRYVVHEGGWLDALSAVPAPGFRLARLGHVRREGRKIRKYGLPRLLENGGAEVSTISLIVAVFLTFCVVEFGSIWIMRPESNAESANITSAADAIWWSYVTITTVGYGDRFPVTNHGRIVATVTLSLGVALFAVFTGYISSSFISPKSQRRASEQRDETRTEEIAKLQRLVEALSDELRSAEIRGLRSAVDALGEEIRLLRSSNSH